MTQSKHTLSENSKVPSVDRDRVVRLAIRAYGHVPGMMEYFNYLLSSRDPKKSNYFKPTEEYLNVPLSTKLSLAAFGIGSLIIVGIIVKLIGYQTNGNGTATLEFIGLLIIMCIGMHFVSRKRLKKEARTRSGHCRSCNYNLEGHDSLGTVLFNQYKLDVGPSCCPECGHKYPRITG